MISKEDIDFCNSVRQKFGMLAEVEDIFYFKKILELLPPPNNFLELGSYVGGSLIFFNTVLKNIGVNSNFTSIDHLEELGKNFINHNKKIEYSENELNDIYDIKTTNDAINFIKKRSKILTGFDINLQWFKTVDELDHLKYDVIFQDFSSRNYSQEITNLTGLLDKNLKNDGVYVIDDANISHVTRLFSSFKMIQDNKLYPILWGKKKIFFSNNKETAIELIQKLKNIKKLVLIDPIQEFSIDYPTLMDNGNPL